MTKEQLDKINKFTRREFSEDEIYAFSVILCDNDIDRDGEQFSENALVQLSKLFIGRTGIFDHSPKSSNQNMRIYDTQVVTDSSRKTSDGQTYKYLKAFAYMVRTDENRSLIAEIDGGIKKEVSISCSAPKRTCSVCGCDRSKSRCVHVKGKNYNGKICHIILDNISDAYEWSFVAVPAQVNAGVIKKMSGSCHISDFPQILAETDRELRRDIRRLAFFSGGKNLAEAVSKSAEIMDTSQLISLKKSLENTGKSSKTEIQLAPAGKDDALETDSFSMK